MDDLASVFKALGDETRLAIMALLIRHGELCVCDFEGVLGISQSKSSRHLRYLLHAGLVENRRQGVWMHYRLVKKPDARVKTILSALGRVTVGPRFDELDARLSSWLVKKESNQGACREDAR
jgi:DNA-binding transcriptional ArsR family regulator